MPSYVGYKALGMGFDAHLTVCYFGDNAEEETLKEIRNVLVGWGPTSYVTRNGIGMFGPLNDIPVLKVSVPSALWGLRSELEKYSVSQFSDWNPHITLDLKNPELVLLPRTIFLSDLGVY